MPAKIGSSVGVKTGRVFSLETLRIRLTHRLREATLHFPVSPADTSCRHGPHQDVLRGRPADHQYRGVSQSQGTNFDIDKVFVHQLGHVFVFERFMGEYMTPMAGRVPYRQEDGLVFLLCSSDGLGIPFLPL